MQDRHILTVQFDDRARRMEEVEPARREQEKLSGLKEGKEKSEQEDVQSSVKTRIRAHRHNGGGRFFSLVENRMEVW